jgi:hypothetical protein
MLLFLGEEGWLSVAIAQSLTADMSVIEAGLVSEMEFVLSLQVTFTEDEPENPTGCSSSSES